MREDERRDLQIAGLATLVLACGALRIAEIDDPGPLELAPVLAAAWWFGRRWALIVAGIASVPLLVAALGDDPGFEPATAPVRAALLLGAAQVAGLLSDAVGRQSEELDRLRPLQDAIAPRVPVELPLLEVATRYIPAQSGVAGDFYLVVGGPNNATVIVVGDVAGKGIDAARRAIFVRATVTACAPYSDDPAALLRTANAELIRQYGVSRELITMLCVVIAPDGMVRWCSAGHPFPVSLVTGDPIAQPVVGYPLGIAPEIPGMETAHGPLPPEGILLYTDGLTDARPPGSSFQAFGEYRIGMFLRELAEPTPEEAVDTLAKAARRFAHGELTDDVCLVAVRSRVTEPFQRSLPNAALAATPAPPPAPAGEVPDRA